MTDKGERRFTVWHSYISGRIWAGWMTYDGDRWVCRGEKYDVTDDALVAVKEKEERRVEHEEPR